MKLILSIILAAVAAFIVAAIEAMLRLPAGEKLAENNSNDETAVRRYKLKGVKPLESMKALIIGGAVGLINYFSPKATGEWAFLAPIFLIVMLGLMAYLAYWWHQEASDWKEGFWYGLLAVLFFLTAGSAATMTAAMLGAAPFWSALIGKLPIIALVFVLFFFAVDALFFRYENPKGEDKEEADAKATNYHLGAWILMILKTLIILGIIGSLLWTYWPFGGSSTPDDETVTVKNAFPSSFNKAMLNDSDSSNDYNFGYDFSEDGKTAADYDKELRYRMGLDPALGAADMAWLDCLVGTRYMGVFYDECSSKWDAAMNAAKESFIKDQVGYYKTLDKYFEFLDSATKVEIKEASGIEDQMYQNPFVDGFSDIIVMKTDNHTGTFLVYTFVIKGKTVEVAYRIECGFQPCNVAKAMGITPKNQTTSTPKKTTSTPKKTTSTPSKPSTPSNPKDPTKGTKVGKNDTSGPGPDTNNGVGAQYSKEEKPTNSVYKNYEEYKETVSKLEETNKTQKKGGDSNTPTTTPQSGTTVHSNADKGTGNGGIDESTSVDKPVHIETPSGGTTQISSDLAPAWGGPPD